MWLVLYFKRTHMNHREACDVWKCDGDGVTPLEWVKTNRRQPFISEDDRWVRKKTGEWVVRGKGDLMVGKAWYDIILKVRVVYMILSLPLWYWCGYTYSVVSEPLPPLCQHLCSHLRTTCTPIWAAVSQMLLQWLILSAVTYKLPPLGDQI